MRTVAEKERGVGFGEVEEDEMSGVDEAAPPLAGGAESEERRDWKTGKDFGDYFNGKSCHHRLDWN